MPLFFLLCAMMCCRVALFVEVLNVQEHLFANCDNVFFKNIFAEQVGEKSDQKRRKLQFRDLHSGKERFLIIAMLG